MTPTLTDLSPGMAAEAVERARAAGFAAVTGRECDVQDLPFSDSSFDVVVANHMLYHVPDPERALTEVARVLAPDGVLLAATNGHGHTQEIDELVAACFGERTGGLYDVFGIDSGERKLRMHFAHIVWHVSDNDLVVTDPDAVIAYGMSYPPGSEGTEAQRERFADAVRVAFAGCSLRIHNRSGAFVCREPRA